MLQTFYLDYEWQERVTIGPSQGSLFHGLLMNHFDQDYAAHLHQTNLAEFRQSVHRLSKNKIRWTLTSLTSDANKAIIDFVNEQSASIYLDKKATKLTRVDYQESFKTDYRHIYKKTLEKFPVDYIMLDFQTATAFRSQKRYIKRPDIRLILQNISFRQNDLQTDIQFEKHYFKELAQSCSIIMDDTRTVKYPIGGQQIPAYQGKILVKLSGNDTEKYHTTYLLNLANYTGLGIKTALGMGCVVTTNLYKE